MEPEALEREAARRAREGGLLAPGDAVLVAASGGADSAALASVLAAGAAHGLPLRLVLGHVDHGWRGPEEAAADLGTVRALGARIGVPVDRAGPPTPVRRTEDDARRFRYGALADLARRHGCCTVATGHHALDQVETVLLRLARGSGPAGLRGIPQRRPLRGGPLHVVRPLLWAAAADLRLYVAARGLPHREDPTNATLDRDRARLRARLSEDDPRGARAARLVARALPWLERRLEREERDVATRLGESLAVHAEARAVVVSARALAALPAGWASTALRALGRPLGADRDGPWFARRHADLVHGLASGSRETGSVALPRGLEARRLGPRLVLFRAEAPALEEVVLEVDEGPGGPEGREGEKGDVASARAGPFTARRSSLPASSFDAAAFAAERRAAGPRPPWLAALDAERLGARVAFRAVRESDRFVPLGECAETEVLRFLGKRGVAGPLRRGVRVAATAAGVAWVVGHRIDARVAVTSRTRRVAILEATVESARDP